MKTSRDDSSGACGHCGKPLPGRSGGGRRADYCNRSCQMKEYRARKRATESSRDDSALAERVQELAAALAAERAKTASLRRQLAAAKAAVSPVVAPSAPSSPQDDLAPAPTPLGKRPGSRGDTAPPVPEAVVGEVFEEGPDRWRVELGGEVVGAVQRHTRVRELVLGHPEEYVEWSGRTAGGREVWGGGPPRDLDDAVRMITHDARGWMRSRHRQSQPVKLGKARKDGSRLAKQGTYSIGEVGKGISGWHGRVGSGRWKRVLVGVADETKPLQFATAQAAAEALAAYSWQTADDFWRGNDPTLRDGPPVLRELPEG